MSREIDLSKPLSDEDVAYLKERFPLELVNHYVETASAKEESGSKKADAPSMKEGDDPGDFNVTQVQEFLLTASDEEAARVREAEAAGQGRKGILEG